MPKYLDAELMDLARTARIVFGDKHQLGVAIEEAGEFVAEASKVTNRGEQPSKKLISEVADLIIMSEQLRQMFEYELRDMLPEKMAKLKMHIENEKAKGEQ